MISGKTIAIGLLLSVYLPMQMLAQDTSARAKTIDTVLRQSIETLSEITVKSVAGAKTVKESPVPVAIVSLKKIERTTESNIIDVLVKNVPGLNAVKTGPNISKPFIRGLGYNRVLTLYNGIRQEGQQWGDEHGIEVDAYNIEKAEVIKGPSSLLYGSDALAGVVTLIPAMPSIMDSGWHGKYIAEYQSNNGLIGNGGRVTYTKTKWTFALRGSYRIARNYTNSIDGRVYNTGFRETNASASAKYTGNSGCSDLHVTLYDNLQGIPDGSRDSLTRRFTKQVYEGVLDNIKNRPIVSNGDLNSYQLSPLHQHIQHYRIYSSSHYKAGAGNIDMLLALQQNIRREYSHPTMPPQAGMYVRLNTLNYGLKYNMGPIFNTELTFGFNGMYQNNKNKDATGFPIPDYKLLDAGGYFFAKWQYQHLIISGGIRYDVRLLQGNDFYTRTDSVTGFSSHISPVAVSGAYLQFPAFNKMFSGMSVSMGATYEINRHLSLKANIARGYRAPSITEFASNGLDPGAHIVYLGDRDFTPEFSLQEDVGLEADMRDWSASFSVFNNNIAHYIYLTQLTDVNGNPVTDAQGNKTFQYQQSSAQLYGLEGMINLHPEYIKGFSFDNSFAVVYGFNRKTAYKDKGLNGQYLPLIPPFRLLTSVSQNIKTGSKTFSLLTLRAEAEVNAAQNRYLALDNTETATPAYTLFNVSASTKIHYSKAHELQVLLQVNNLLDKAYQSNLSRLKYFEYYTQSPTGHLGMYNMGRNVCLKLIAGF